MAMACFLSFTGCFPCFMWRISVATSSCALGPYLRPVDFLEREDDDVLRRDLLPVEPEDFRALDRVLPEVRLPPERLDAELWRRVREEPLVFLRAVLDPLERDPLRELELFFLEELDFLAGISVRLLAIQTRTGKRGVARDDRFATFV